MPPSQKDSLRYQENGYLEMPADFSLVAQAAERLKGFCHLRCIDSRLWPDVELAFCEAINNAIEHGCQEDPSQIIRIAWQWRERQLEVSIEDPGPYQPLSETAQLPDDPLCDSGRGLYIIQTMTDACHREPTDYGQVLVFRKELHLAQDPMQQMLELYETLHRMTNELNMSYAKTSTLQGLAEDLAEDPDLERIFKKGIERLRAVCSIASARIWIRHRDGLLCRFSDPDAGAQKADDFLALDQACSLTEAFAQQSPRFIRKTGDLPSNDPIYASSGCGLLCPIVYQGEPIGVIGLRANPSEGSSLEGPVLGLTQAMAQFLGIAITSANTYKHREERERAQTQLEVASEIQRSLLPSQYPNNRYCRMAGRCETALEVGGDYIDAVEIKDLGLLIVIADVMGKGVPAALLATIFRTAIRSRLNLSETPGWLLSQINKQIHQELGHLNMFITAQAAFLSYGSRKLKLASAGHCPALLLPQGQDGVQFLAADGIPLGIDPGDIYEERLIDARAGDRLLFLTDGLYETEDQGGRMLGLEGFASQLDQFWSEGLNTLPSRVMDFLACYSDGRPPQDDRTLMALEIL